MCINKVYLLSINLFNFYANYILWLCIRKFHCFITEVVLFIYTEFINLVMCSILKTQKLQEKKIETSDL